MKVSVHNSIAALSELLAVEDDPSYYLPLPPPISDSGSVVPPVSKSLSWLNLRVMDCSLNFVAKIDESIVSFDSTSQYFR